MTKKIFLSIPFLAAIILITTGCPQPLTEDDVVAAQDKLSPTITVFSPEESDIYYSTVDFSLKVVDDAQSEADSQGDLATIAFDIANDDLRGGSVSIGPDGTLTQSGSDEIVYDPATGLVSFSFSTIEPNILSGLISVTLTATDRNGNASEQRMTLADNEGPFIEYTILDLTSNLERSFTEDTTIRLSGTLANSSEDKETADQITDLSWTVLGKTWSGILEIDKEATYVSPSTSETLSYYNASLDRYERENDGITFPELFIYDPSTRTFTTDIYIPFGAGTSLPFEVTVTDKNSRTTTLAINAFTNESGPEVVIEYPAASDTAYFSAVANSSDRVEGYINGGIGDLQSFTYEITDSTGDYTSGKLSSITAAFNSSDPRNANSNEFVIDPEIVELKHRVTDAAFPAGGGDINITIFAVNDKDIETRPKVTVVEDSAGPVISGLTFVSNHANNGYARDDSNLTLSFNASDNSSPVSSLQVTTAVIAGDSAASVVGTGSYTVTPSAWTGPAYSEAALPYTVTIEDDLGNATTVTQATSGAPQVVYYSGDPDATLLDSISMAGQNVPTAYAVAGEDIQIDVNSSRDIASINNINAPGFSSSIAYDGGDSTRAVITLSRADMGVETPANFTFDITDRAGNSTSVGEGNSINQGDLPGGIPVFYDSLVPSAPTVQRLASADETSLTTLPGGGADNITSNTTSLTIEGSAEVNSSVTLYRDGVSSFNTTANGVGNWSGDIPGSLTEGTYNLTARATDAAGNTSPASSILPLQIQTSLPSSPGSIDLNAASDSTRIGLAGGTSDNITNIDTGLQIDGTTVANGYILLSIGGSQQSNFIQANGAGNWSTTINLPTATGVDQNYTVSAKAADAAGNESVGSQSMVVRVDKKKNDVPTITLDAADDSGFSSSDNITRNYTNLTFQGTTSETDEYEISLRGTNSGGAIAALTGVTAAESGGTWSRDISLNTGSDEDVNTIYAKAVDRAGNESNESSMTLTLDVTRPTFTSVNAVDLRNTNDSGFSSTDNITNETGQIWFDVNVNVYDSVNDLDFAGDSLYLELTSDKEGVFLHRTGISSSGMKNLQTDRGLIEDSHSISATVYDAAGNSATTSPASLGVTTDFTAPASTDVANLTLDAGSDTGLYDNDGITNAAGDLTFLFDVTNYEEESYVELTSSVDAGVLAQGSVSSGGTGKSLTISGGVTENSHTITATLYDRAGNTRGPGITTTTPITKDRTVASETIDTARLTTSLDTGFSNSDGITKNNSGITFDVDISAEPEPYYLRLVRTPGSETFEGEVSSLSDAYSIPAATVWSNGSTYSVAATLFDIAGNQVDTRTITNPVQIDTAPSSATVTGVSLNSAHDLGFQNNDGLTSRNNTLGFDISVSAEPEPFYLELIGDPAGGGPVTLLTEQVSALSATYATSAALSEDTHSIEAYLYDLAGNAIHDTSASPITVVTDYTASPATVTGVSLNSAHDLGFLNSDGITNRNNTLDFDISVSAEPEPFYLELIGDPAGGGPVTLLTEQVSALSASYATAAALSEDTHSIEAYLYDLAGNAIHNTSASPITVVTDYSASPATITGVSLNSAHDLGFLNSDGITNRNNTLDFDISVSAEPEPFYVELFSDPASSGIINLFTQEISALSASYTSSAALSEDTHSIDAYLYDLAGNAIHNTSASPITVVTDYTSSSATITSVSLNSAHDLGILNNDGITSRNNTLDFDIDVSAEPEPFYVELISAIGPTTLLSLEISALSASYTTSAALSENLHNITAYLYDIAGNSINNTAINVTTDYTGPQFVGITSQTDGVLVLELEFNEDLRSDVFDGSNDPIALSFTAPDIPAGGLIGNYTFKASFNGGNEKKLQLKALNLTSNPVDFPQYSNVILTFNTNDSDGITDFGDDAGNFARRNDDPAILNALQFHVNSSSSPSTPTQSGLETPFSPPILIAEDPIQTSTPLASGYVSPQNDGETKGNQNTAQYPESPTEAELNTSEPETTTPAPASETTQPIQKSVSDTSPPEIPEQLQLQFAAASVPARIEQDSLLPTTEEYTQINRDALLFMEQVESERQDFGTLMDQIRMSPVSRERLILMDDRMTPVIPEVETITLYSSPIPTAFEAPVTMAAEETVLVSENDRPVLFLLIQALVALSIGALTFLFLWIMNRLQRKGHGILD